MSDDARNAADWIDSPLRFAGWFTVDLRMVAILCLFAAAVATTVVALHFKGKRWDEYAVGFAAVFLITLLATGLATNLLALFPALRIESVFAIR